MKKNVFVFFGKNYTTMGPSRNDVIKKGRTFFVKGAFFAKRTFFVKGSILQKNVNFLMTSSFGPPKVIFTSSFVPPSLKKMTSFLDGPYGDLQNYTLFSLKPQNYGCQKFH